MKPYLGLLKPNGILATVGVLEPIDQDAIDFGMVSLKRLTIGGSLIGNLAQTQEVLDFCAEHNITPQIEKISIDQINDAFDTMVDEEVHFRYVIDNATLGTAT